MTELRSAEVWYDGDCALCRASRAWCERRDRRGRLVFRDIRSADDRELPVARTAAEASMWVRDKRGRLVAGFDGWRVIMSELPGWRWLARLAGIPPFSWLGPPVYRIVARSRRLVF
jgi:predicted DCC family thiol-disulfide oxidoreductase YuxK